MLRVSCVTETTVRSSDSRSNIFFGGKTSFPSWDPQPLVSRSQAPLCSRRLAVFPLRLPPPPAGLAAWRGVGVRHSGVRHSARRAEPAVGAAAGRWIRSRAGGGAHEGGQPRCGAGPALRPGGSASCRCLRRGPSGRAECALISAFHFKALRGGDSLRRSCPMITSPSSLVCP